MFLSITKLQALLQFVYTDGLDENEENVGVAETLTAKLLAAADRYELKRLKRMCESRLCRYVTQDPYQVFSLANRHHAEELRSICVEFALHNPIGTRSFFFFSFSFSESLKINLN